jgi:hypothetical protein
MKGFKKLRWMPKPGSIECYPSHTNLLLEEKNISKK